MSNLEVTLAHFYQFAGHWSNGDQAKLNLSCETGKLQLEFSAHLDHPDLAQFATVKKQSSSRIRWQERRHPDTREVTKDPETMVKSEHIKLKDPNDAQIQTANSCNICGKICKLDQNLVNHVHKVHNVCNICEIRFKNHETLQKHFLMYHIPNTFKCFHCEKSFNKAHYLRIHARETHNQCDNCEQ